MHLLPFEAFRCLIDDDEKGGKRIAAALATLAGRYAKDMDKWSGTDNWQSIYWLVNSDSLGLTYDWAYPWMTDSPRAVVRKTIAGMTRGKTFLGLDQLPAVPGNTSNWIIIHANLLPMVLSIEGEEGYDPAVYARLVEGLRKWVYVAAACDGAPFEGLAKSTYAPQWLIPLAKRGEAFIGPQWALNHVRKYHLAVEDGSERHSVILIDGQGQGHQCPAGRTVALADAPAATFAAGDATWAYSHALAEPTNKKATPITITPNDSRLRPSGLPWMSQPWSFMPSWNKGEKGGGRHGNWGDYNPVKYAFRTASLVRGKHPYVVITDDIRKADAEHLYEWLMQAPDDLELAAKPAGGGDAGAAFDLVLAEKGGDRRLLVRVLQAGASPAEQAACRNGARLETYKSIEGRTEVTAKRLVLPLKAAAGTYKVLLFAHRQGEALPVTTWDAGRTKLAVQWPDLKDEYTFTPNPDGRTRVAMSRDGHAVAEVK